MLQSYTVVAAGDTMHDFERLQLMRMREDDLQRFIADWDNLLLECREPPGTCILDSLFRAQIRRRYLTKQDVHDYNKMVYDDPNTTSEWLRKRLVANLELRRLGRNPHNLKNESNRHVSVICAASKSGGCRN
eukprot:1499643-Pyramimonas_sp.AAC.1